ncbi:MAG: translocation and assembly module TamB, partial [Halieaceae bacterium]
MIRRISVWLALAIPALLLIGLLVLAWSVGTASGMRAAWSIVGNALPGLTVASLEGRLAGPLKIRELRYADEYRELSVDSIDLDWLPTRLLGRSFRLENLQIAGVKFTQLKPAPVNEDDTEFALPESIDLPVDLVLRNVALWDIEFRSTPEGEPLEIDSVEITASLLDQHLLVDALSVRGPLFGIRASSDALTRDNFDSTTKIDWTAQPPELAAAAGKLLITGGLAELQIQHSVSAPYSLEQSVTLKNILHAMSFDAQTRIANLRLSEIGDNLPDLAFRGDIHGQGDVGNVNFDTTLQAESLSLGQFSLRASGGIKDQVLAISQLLLTGDDAMRLAAAGEV